MRIYQKKKKKIGPNSIVNSIRVCLAMPITDYFAHSNDKTPVSKLCETHSLFVSMNFFFSRVWAICFRLKSNVNIKDIFRIFETLITFIQCQKGIETNNFDLYIIIRLDFLFFWNLFEFSNENVEQNIFLLILYR